MRVLYRLLILSGILCVLLLAGFLLIDQIQAKNTAILAQVQREKIAQLFDHIHNLENKQLEVDVFHFAFWDELVEFVSNQNEAFARDVLDKSLAESDIDYIWIFDPDAQQVYFTNRNGAAQPVELPFSDEQIRQLFQNSAFVHFHVLLPGGQLVEIQGATIHPSNDITHQTPAKGFFFAGSLWNANRLDLLSTLTGSRVDIVSSNTAAQAQQDPLSDIIVAYPLLDWSGGTLAFVQGTFANQYAAGYQQGRHRNLLVYSVFALVFIAVLFGGLARWVTYPLNFITESLVLNSVEPLQPHLTDQSEFGNIARQIEVSFDQQAVMTTTIHRHQLTERALRESEERYRIVSELVSDAVFALSLDESGRSYIEWGQDAVFRLTGYNEAFFEDIDQFKTAVYLTDWPDFQKKLAEMQGGETITTELRFRHADGRLRWMRLHVYPVIDPYTSSLTRLYGAAQDITAEKNAQETYRELVDHSPIGLAIFQDGMICFANRALEEVSGYSQDEIQQMSADQVSALFHPDDRIQMDQTIHGTPDRALPNRTFELRLREKTGAWRWLSVSAARIQYLGKEALQFTFSDISARKQAEQALIHQQKYASAILSTVDALVMVLDRRGSIVSINPAGLHMLRTTSHELVDKSLWEVFSIPREATLSEENFNTLVETRTPLHNQDIWARHAGGRIWLSWSMNYLLDDDGQVTGVVGTANDVSERKIRERQREAIAAIAGAVRATSTRQEIAELTLKVVDEFMQVESVAIGFVAPHMQHIILEHVTGTLKNRLLNQKLPMDNSISGEVFRSGKPYLTNDLKSERNFYTKDLLDSVNASAWIPLVAEGASMGVIIVSSSRSIEQAEYNTLVPVADMAASAMQRAVLAEQMQQRLQHLTALRTINVSIGSSFDLRVTLNVLVNQIHTQLGVDAVDVLLLEPNTRLLKCVASNGFRSRAVDEMSFWLGEGLVGRIALERQPVQFFEPKGIASNFSNREWLALEEFVAYHAIPLLVKGEVKGVLETFHRAPYTGHNDFIQLLEALAMETAIAIDKSELLETLQRTNQDISIAYDKTIEGWARALEMRDQDTEGHTRRVAEWTTRLAQACGITGANLMHIRRGALLHDLGKIGVPDVILLKAGPLTEEEWVVMRKHPILVYEMLSSIEFLRPALDIPYCHHERWDGSGYPRGLRGEEIPIAARIFAVIDVWDALRHDRYYRKAWPEDETVAYIKEQAGKTLDPEIVGIFLDLRPLLTR